jgi:hypothetical protein
MQQVNMKRDIFFWMLTVNILFFNICSGSSRVNDAALWENICLTKDIAPRWNFRFNHEGRINENMTRFYYAYGDFGISYKWNKHIHIAFDYVFIKKRLLSDFWSTRHQIYAALTLKQKIGPFVFYDRVMPQIQYSDIYSSKKGMVPDYYLRNKVTVKYNNFSRYTYYVAAELYYKLYGYYKSSELRVSQFNRVRYFAGAFYELNKANAIELYFLYQRHFNINFSDSYNPSYYVLGIGYTHSFY